MPKRTGQQRIDAITPAVERRDEFFKRIEAAEGDSVRCADLMVEAINMQSEANGIEPVGHDGKSFVGIEHIMAAHCLFKARDAYLKARGSNSQSLR